MDPPLANCLDDHIINALKASSPQTAQELVKRLSHYTKSDINSCLYRLQKWGCVAIQVDTCPPKWLLSEDHEKLESSTAEVLDILTQSPMTTNELVAAFRTTLTVANVNAILLSLEASKEIRKNKTLWMRTTERDRLIDRLTAKLLNLPLEALKKLDEELK
ncbi:Hypothetical protein POVR1_LOCUS265 [uncultured virus]|nr:Hypothetical protein POVR1_LOCUS265 [uncultured virus]